MPDKREKNQIYALIATAQATPQEEAVRSRLQAVEAIVHLIKNNAELLRDFQSVTTVEEIFEFVLLRLFVTVGQPFSFTQENMANSQFRAGYLSFLRGFGRNLIENDPLEQKISVLYMSSADFSAGRSLGEEALAVLPGVMGKLAELITDTQLRNDVSDFIATLRPTVSVSKRAFEHAAPVMLSQRQLEQLESTAVAMLGALERKGHIIGQPRVELPILFDEDHPARMADEIQRDLESEGTRTASINTTELIELARKKVLSSVGSNYFLLGIMYGRYSEQFLEAFRQYLVNGEPVVSRYSAKDYSAQAGIMTAFSVIELIEWTAKSLAWRIYSPEYDNKVNMHDKSHFLSTLRDPDDAMSEMVADLEHSSRELLKNGLFDSDASFTKFLLVLLNKFK